MNLLKETIADLKENGKSEGDVLWCGSREFGYFDWDDFKKVADIEYDDGYGGQEVASDLLVVGDSWYMERSEYDGSESWSFKEKPEKPSVKNIPTTVKNGDSWATLTQMNRDGGKYNY